MPFSLLTSIAIGASVVSSVPATPSTGEEKLAYVAAIGPQRSFYCEATPQTGATNSTQITLDFELSGAGPVNAQMVVTGSVQRRFYNARIGWNGTASAQGSKAQIVLDAVTGFKADTLPGDAQWSDPEGDVITLRILPYSSFSSQRYILKGTQETELGTNDLRCLDAPRR